MKRRRKQPEIIRTAHGSAAAALLVAECPPLDEIPPTIADDTERGLTIAKGRGRPFERGNAAAQNRRPVLAMLGVPLDNADQRCRTALSQANKLRQRRCRELAISHGGYLGAGPASMLGSAARALAASTLLYMLATEAFAKNKTKEAAELFASSARLADSARQQELTAVALSEREHIARKKTANVGVDYQQTLRAKFGIVEAKDETKKAKETSK